MSVSEAANRDTLPLETANALTPSQKVILVSFQRVVSGLRLQQNQVADLMGVSPTTVATVMRWRPGSQRVFSSRLFKLMRETVQGYEAQYVRVYKTKPASVAWAEINPATPQDKPLPATGQEPPGEAVPTPAPAPTPAQEAREVRLPLTVPHLHDELYRLREENSWLKQLVDRLSEKTAL